MTIEQRLDIIERLLEEVVLQKSIGSLVDNTEEQYYRKLVDIKFKMPEPEPESEPEGYAVTPEIQ